MGKFRPKIYQSPSKKITLFLGLCKGCGLCVEKCPQKALAFSTKDFGVYNTPSVKIDLKKCNLCKLCEITCPDSALKIEKKKEKNFSKRDH